MSVHSPIKLLRITIVAIHSMENILVDSVDVYFEIVVVSHFAQTQDYGAKSFKQLMMYNKK